MSRLLGALLILCAQVFAVLAPGTVVVCSHADGTSETEFVGALCCEAAHDAAASAALDAAENADARGPSVRPSVQPCDDDCHDTPLRQDLTAVGRSTPELARDAANEHSSPSPAAAAWTASSQFVAVRSGRHEAVPRPPGTAPRRLVIVPLRI